MCYVNIIKLCLNNDGNTIKYYYISRLLTKLMQPSIKSANRHRKHILMRYDFKTLCRNAAERGEQMQKRLLDTLGARHNIKTLPEFGIERAAELAGCTANHIRNLEAREEIPKARTIKAGSTDRRIYNYNEINGIKGIIGTRPSRPEGTGTLRIVFSNLKGGVAKTTMSLHFAQYAAREGYRVLLIDVDPQATITSALGMLSINAICAANMIIMPITPHMYDISSSIQYFKILEELCNLYGREINV